MARVSYLEGTTSQYGYEFNGEPVEVVNPVHLEKFRGNRFFEVDESEPAKDEGLKAVHRGRGSYSIIQDGKEIREGLSKADADAFNAMSDEDKSAYVAD